MRLLENFAKVNVSLFIFHCQESRHFYVRLLYDNIHFYVRLLYNNIHFYVRLLVAKPHFFARDSKLFAIFSRESPAKIWYSRVPNLWEHRGRFVFHTFSTREDTKKFLLIIEWVGNICQLEIRCQSPVSVAYYPPIGKIWLSIWSAFVSCIFIMANQRFPRSFILAPT